MRLTPLQLAKRAARQNATFKAANVYTVAHDNGDTVLTAEGDLQYDLAEETLGFVQMQREETLTATPTYKGDHKITVISEVAPNGAALILIDGVFYSIKVVMGGDPQSIHVEYGCFSLGPEDAPTIRSTP